MTKQVAQRMLEQRFLTPWQVENAQYATRINQAPLCANLVKLGYVSETKMLNFVSNFLGIPILRDEIVTTIHPKLIDLLPRDIVSRYWVIPVGMKKGQLVLGQVYPLEQAEQARIETYIGMRTIPGLLPEDIFLQAVTRFYGISVNAAIITEDLLLALENYEPEQGRPKPPTGNLPRVDMSKTTSEIQLKRTFAGLQPNVSSVDLPIDQIRLLDSGSYPSPASANASDSVELRSMLGEDVAGIKPPGFHAATGQSGAVEHTLNLSFDDNSTPSAGTSLEDAVELEPIEEVEVVSLHDTNPGASQALEVQQPVTLDPVDEDDFDASLKMKDQKLNRASQQIKAVKDRVGLGRYRDTTKRKEEITGSSEDKLNFSLDDLALDLDLNELDPGISLKKNERPMDLSQAIALEPDSLEDVEPLDEDDAVSLDEAEAVETLVELVEEPAEETSDVVEVELPEEEAIDEVPLSSTELAADEEQDSEADEDDDEEYDEEEYEEEFEDMDASELMLSLAEADTRDEIIQTSCQWLATYFRAALFFTVKGNTLNGFQAEGLEMDRDTLKGKQFTVEGDETPLAELLDERIPVYEQGKDDPVFSAMLSEFGMNADGDVVALPVLLKEKLIGVVIGLDGQSEDVVPIAEAWEEVGEKISAAFDAMILAQKLGV